MLIAKLFKSIFLDSFLSEPNIDKRQVSYCDNNDLMTKILYESFIPLDALIFHMGISYPSKSELNHIVDNILTSKKLILQNASNMTKFFNLEFPGNEKGTLKEILQMRDDIIRADKSYEFKEMVKSNLFSISKCIEEKIATEHKNQIFTDPKKDKEFRKMVFRLKEYIEENLDINDLLTKERNEFYRIYKKTNKIRRSKISLNLGGSIFNLKDMANIVYKINMPNKDKILREWLGIMLKPIEELQKSNIKGFMIQKFNVLDFLTECITRKTGQYDSAFEIRDLILEAANLSENEKNEFLKRQIAETKKLKKAIENINKEQWLIKYSRQAKEDYVDYLLSGQELEKKKLIDNFGK